MACEPSVPTTVETIPTSGNRCLHHSLCWGAVLAGTIAALGIHLLLTVLGVGAGLAIFRPMTDTNPVATFSVGSAIVWSLFAIIALSFGGWVAGRFSGCPKSGLVHGVLVWSLTLIIILPLLALGTGLALGRVMKIHGEGLGIGHQAVVFAGRDMAKTAAKHSHDQLCSFVEEAVQSIPTNAAPKAGIRAQREVGFAVAKLFAPGNAAAFQANRLEAINALMVYTEMSAADATTTIDAWTTSHKNLQAELDKIKAEAEHHLSCAARWSFFALLIGLLGAALGGRCGAKCALRNASLQRASVTPV